MKIFFNVRRIASNTSWILAFGLLALATSSAASERDTAKTRLIANDFVHMQFEMKKRNEAKAKYYAPDFIQHNPEIKVGPYGTSTFIEDRQKANPEKYLPDSQWVDVIDNVLVEDKYFAVHHHVFTNPKDAGRVFVDIYRVENGKIMEHWDIIQNTYENPLNKNTMWGNMVKAKKPAPRDPAPQAVIDEYLRIGLVEHNQRAAAEKYIATNFIQHSPHIPEGRQGLLDYFKAREASATTSTATLINSVNRIIADGDIVMIVRHAMQDVKLPGVMAVDIFRVQQGKIVEHWDLKQDVPETSANGNTMW